MVDAFSLKTESINVEHILNSRMSLDQIVQAQDLNFEHYLRQQECVQNLKVIEQVFWNVVAIAKHSIALNKQKDALIEDLRAELARKDQDVLQEQATASLHLDESRMREKNEIDRKKYEILMRDEMFGQVQSYSEVQTDYSKVFKLEMARETIGESECKVNWVAHQALKLLEEDQLGHLMLVNKLQNWLGIKQERQEIKQMLSNFEHERKNGPILQEPDQNDQIIQLENEQENRQVPSNEMEHLGLFLSRNFKWCQECSKPMELDTLFNSMGEIFNPELTAIETTRDNN